MELLINRELLVKAYCDTPNHRHFLHELYAHLENLWCADQVELWSQLSIHDGQRLLTIGIHCIDRDVSTHTYRALQAIGEAKILIKGNKPIWHESFGTNEGFMKLVSIVDECRCVIRRDVDMKILRLYGSPKMRSICRYNLDLMMEKQKIGMDPILETQDLRGYEGDNEDNPTGPKCPICWMEVSRGIQTDCGHDCCLDCLIDQGAAGLSPLRCFGLDGKCGQSLSLKWLWNALGYKVFVRLLRGSLAQYIQHRPPIFAHCPVPDCTQVYQKTVDGGTMCCPKCRNVICTTCNALKHEGVTCDQYNRSAFREWKRIQNIKDCPGCGALIQKTWGCDHMTCRCGEHFC